MYGVEKPSLSMSSPTTDMHPVWHGCSIAGPRLRMLEFSAYVEQQQLDSELVTHGFYSIRSYACDLYGKLDSTTVALVIVVRFFKYAL